MKTIIIPICLVAVSLLCLACQREQKPKVIIPKSNDDPSMMVFASSKQYSSPFYYIKSKTHVDTAHNHVTLLLCSSDPKEEDADSIRLEIDPLYQKAIDTVINIHRILKFDVLAENGSIKHYTLEVIKSYIEHYGQHYYYSASPELAS